MACLSPIGQPPKPHIHSATFNQKSPSRPDPGQGRAATDSDTCANSHFMATPGHQSLLLPCIQAYPYRRHRPLPTRSSRTRRNFSALSPMAALTERLMGHRPWTTDRGSWTWHDVSLSPNHRHPPLRVAFSPLSHQIPSGVHSVP